MHPVSNVAEMRLVGDTVASTSDYSSSGLKVQENIPIPIQFFVICALRRTKTK